MLNVNEIYAIKLTSGEEIISRIKEVNGEFISLDEPRSLITSPNGNLQFAPTMFLAHPDHPVKLAISSVAFYSEKIREELLTAYRESVSTIITPKKSILM